MKLDSQRGAHKLHPICFYLKTQSSLRLKKNNKASRDNSSNANEHIDFLLYLHPNETIIISWAYTVVVPDRPNQLFSKGFLVTKPELPHTVYACVFRIAMRFSSTYVGLFMSMERNIITLNIRSRNEQIQQSIRFHPTINYVRYSREYLSCEPIIWDHKIGIEFVSYNLKCYSQVWLYKA